MLFPIDDVQKQGFTYIADREQVDEALRPYEWYKRLVVAGAREHGFPPDYIHEVNRVQAITDPDTQRRAKNEALAAEVEGAARAWTADL